MTRQGRLAPCLMIQGPDPRWGEGREDPYDRLADIMGEALDMKSIASLVGLACPRATDLPR